METLISYKDTPLYLALKEANVSEELAIAATIRFIDGSKKFATKEDIAELRKDTDAEIAELRKDMESIKTYVEKRINTLLKCMIISNIALYLAITWLMVSIISLIK